MHHHLVIKIHAPNLDDGKEEVRSIMEESVEDSNNTVGWDYVGDISQIILDKAKDKINLEEEYGVKTFEALEKKLLNEGKDVSSDLELIKNHLFALLAPAYLSGKEAPTYLGTDDERVTDIATKAIQSGKIPVLPQNFHELLEVFLKNLNQVAKKDGMLIYYIRKLTETYRATRNVKDKKIQGYSDAAGILQCTEAPFMEMWSSSLNPKKPVKHKIFYFVADRHF
jgi:hypothetical protein